MSCGGTSRGLAGTKMAWPLSFLLAILSLGSVAVADLPNLTARATSGDRNAQISLGIAYRDGKGVDRNYAEALAWFRKAAEKNDAAALDNLGWMYEYGLGTTSRWRPSITGRRPTRDTPKASGIWDECMPRPPGAIMTTPKRPAGISGLSRADTVKNKPTKDDFAKLMMDRLRQTGEKGKIIYEPEESL